MQKPVQLILAIFTITILSQLSSAQIVFEFDNETTPIGSGLDDFSTGSFSVSGLVMTATASVPAFNATSSKFGINQSASGDDTSGFDFGQAAGPGVSEGLALSFSQNVQLVNINVSSWNAGNDMVSISVGATPVTTVTSTGDTSLGSFFVSANTDVTILTTGGVYGNGWSLDSFAVNNVPEPTSLLMFGMAMAGGFGFRRRRV